VRRIGVLGRAMAVALLLGAGPSEAIMPFGPCDHPSVFTDAAINVVVVPYEADLQSGAAPAAKQVAVDLPLLIQSTAIGSIMKYGSVGAVGLVAGAGGECSAEAVWAKLDPQLTPGQALVLVWGSLFEEDGALYVQSCLRFARKGVAEGLSFEIGDEV